MHPKRNNVIQFNKDYPSFNFIGEPEMPVKLDKNDLICLITDYGVNGVLNDKYFYRDGSGVYQWNVNELAKCELHELVAIFQWAKFGGVGGAV